MLSVDFIERRTKQVLWRTELGALPAVGDTVVFPSERAVVVIGPTVASRSPTGRPLLRRRCSKSRCLAQGLPGNVADRPGRPTDEA